MDQDSRLIPPHGGYRQPRSFQVAQLAYAITTRFRDRYVDSADSSRRLRSVRVGRGGVVMIQDAVEVAINRDAAP